MKRLIILLGLVVVMLVPQSAQAAPFYFGQNSSGGMSFDDQADVGTNLGYLSTLDVSASFVPAPVADFDRSKAWQFTAVGFSQHSYLKSLAAQVGRRGEDGSAVDGLRFQNEYLTSQVSMGWFRDGGHESELMTLEELIASFVSEVYVLKTDISFQLDQDSELFSFKKGTIFFGVKLPGGNTPGSQVDFIMAAGPLHTPPVPVPAAVWLMGTGLAGLMALRRKSK